MRSSKVFHLCGDTPYCGSFYECSDCSHNDCPVHVVFDYCGIAESETDFFYVSYYRWPSLDYEVTVIDVDKICASIYKKTLYVVIADPLNEDDDFVICAICDNEQLANSLCEDVIEMSDSFRQVYVSEYTLNCLEAW